MVETMASPTPRHSNQSFKYQRVEDPFPVESKVTKTVSKVICFAPTKNGEGKSDKAPKKSRNAPKSNQNDRKSRPAPVKVKDLQAHRARAQEESIRRDKETNATTKFHRSNPKPEASRATPTRTSDDVSISTVSSLGLNALIPAPTASTAASTVSIGSSNKDNTVMNAMSRSDLGDINDFVFPTVQTNKEDPPTTEDRAIQCLDEKIEQLNFTLDAYRKQNKQQTIEIANLRRGTENLKSQLFIHSASRAWHVSEFKNARKQLVQTSLSRKAIEEKLAMEVIGLKRENAKLRASRDRAIQSLRRAPARNNTKEP